MNKKLLLLAAVVAVLAGVGYANGTLANTTLRWPDIELGNVILFGFIILFAGLVIFSMDFSKTRPMTREELDKFHETPWSVNHEFYSILNED